MKVIFLFLTVVIVAVCADEDEKYTSRFDDINLDELLSNQRLVKKHHECLMDRGTCTRELVELKSKSTHKNVIINSCYVSILCV